jgi:hypothetical protein
VICPSRVHRVCQTHFAAVALNDYPQPGTAAPFHLCVTLAIGNIIQLLAFGNGNSSLAAPVSDKRVK